MGEKKLRMNNRKFIRIWSVVLVLILVLAVAATYLMNFFSVTMETQLGRGAQVINTPAEMKDADTDYYDTEVENLDAMTDAAALAIAEEGIVLLKNNDATLPLAEGSAVTPFGYRYVEPVYGGGGSGNVNTSSPRIKTAIGALNEYFSVNSGMEDVLTKAKARGMNGTGYESPDEEGGFEGASIDIIEYEASIYEGQEDSCKDTVGIVYIGRIGGEGGDIAADVEGSPIEGTGYVDGTPHQLAISEDEKDMIRFAKENCTRVVVVLDSSNVLEIGDIAKDGTDISADAIIWIGGPGGQGFEALGEILAGKVNPSGRTVDTWMTDLMSAPSMNNFGNYEYDNTFLLTGGYPNPVGDATEMNFLEYEENVYVGYRFYETVDDTDGSFNVFGESGVSYDDAVIYPFGYGLSYGTDFDQEITSVDETGEDITFTVRVTNNGPQAGKEVVQLYVNPPYTDFDVKNKIEKSTVNLVAFDKTADLAEGESETVTLTVKKEDLASYCYTHENADGTVGSYVLEKGDYIFSLNRNAHEEFEGASETVTISDTVWYDNGNPRQSEKDGQSLLDEQGNATGTPKMTEADAGATFVAATNRFQDLDDHMLKTDQMTRAGGILENNTTTPTAEDKAAVPDYHMTTEDGVNTLAQMDIEGDPILGNEEGSKIYTDKMPQTGAEQELTLTSMRGKSYYDPMWDSLLDQLDLSAHDLYVALTASYDQTGQIAAIGKPATVDFDGPQGIVGSVLDSTEYTAYPSEPIIAATFNVDLTYQMGLAVGKEAASAGVNTWYAPATNIHRAPFSGRNFEYFSEDPILSAYHLINEVNGCASQGLIVTIKHFAMNDEEEYDNDRSRVSIWANEQAMREIYLKPFEMAVKQCRMELKYVDDEGNSQIKVMRGATSIMGCMNYLGTIWGGGSYALLTEVLRNEWGFEGFVVTDMVMNAGSNSVDQCLRAGSDTWMAWGEAFTELVNDKESATAVTTIRRAVKNMCYAIVNSRAMEGLAPGTTITYRMSPWRVGLYTGDAIAACFIILMIIVMVRRTKMAKEHPEMFKEAKKKQ